MHGTSKCAREGLATPRDSNARRCWCRGLEEDMAMTALAVEAAEVLGLEGPVVGLDLVAERAEAEAAHAPVM